MIIFVFPSNIIFVLLLKFLFIFNHCTNRQTNGFSVSQLQSLVDHSHAMTEELLICIFLFHRTKELYLRFFCIFKPPWFKSLHITYRKITISLFKWVQIYDDVFNLFLTSICKVRYIWSSIVILIANPFRCFI